MLSPEDQQSAADLLWRLWREGRRIPELPERLRPAERQEAHAIQALIERHSARRLFGWKIAATSKAGQAHIGVDGPLAGRILAERVHASGTLVPFGANHMRVIEPEFAFRMACDLPPRERPYSTAEVLAAVAELHPSIEIPDSRYDDFAKVGAPQLIADNACAHRFVLGPVSPASWRSLDLAAHRVLTRVDSASGEPLVREGIGANVLGDPRIALTWLVNELSSLGIPLRDGQVVTTGTCAVPLPVQPGDTVMADFGVLGTVELRFGEG